MDRVPVNSKAVSEIGWKDNILEVMYPNGDIYQYPAVDKRTYETLLSPGISIGSYLGTIRRSHAGIKV